MPELYAASGGANRKLSEVYAASGGANRKMREMWAAAGGANRKIFSAYDAKITVSKDNQPANGKIIAIVNNDGSGSIEYQWYKNELSSQMKILFDIELSEPTTTDFLAGSAVMVVNPATKSSFGARSYFIKLTPPGRDFDAEDLDFPPGDNKPTFLRLETKTFISKGVTNFQVGFRFRLQASTDRDAYFSLSWPAGAWTIGDKQLNNVEVIYL